MASAKSKPGSGPQGIQHWPFPSPIGGDRRFAVFPFYWMVTTSFKEQSVILAPTPQLFFHPTLGNYTTAFFKNLILAPGLVNSLIVALSTHGDLADPRRSCGLRHRAI